jgi:hypothetical protein
VLAVFVGVGVGYAAWPYVTLYRLGQAIRSGDAATLQTLVDWPSVREGIKEDVCDLVLDQPQQTAQTAGNRLPPFGASFMRGIAASSIDRAVTPEALVAAVHTPEVSRPATPKGADVHVGWAFFSAPTRFDVSLTVPHQRQPIRLEMRLRHAHWQVHRVWLPDDLLQGANART